MAQTVGPIAVAAAYAAVSTDGSTWTSLGPALISTAPGGGEYRTGETNTMDGKAPVVTGSGKHSAHTIEVVNLYTEESSEAVDIVRTAAADDALLYFRYAPAGNTAGNTMYTAARDDDTTAAAQITNCLPPASDANSGDAARFTFGLMFPKFAESTIST